MAAQKKTGANTGKAIAVGAGIVALSAAAYLLFGPEGKKHRKDLKSWMVRMKADVMDKMEKAKELSKPVYENIVDQVKEKYAKMKDMDMASLEKEVRELKKNWHAVAGKKQASSKARA